MAQTRNRIALALAGLALAAAATAPVRGDWLVTSDGAKMEIKGPWTVKGKLVTFTLPNGTLGSLRLSEVDLEASARETTAAAQPPAAEAAPAEPAKKAPVLVVTDADVSHGSPGVSTPAAPEGAAAEAKEEPAAGPALTVTAWDKDFSDADNGVVVTGTVRNGGKTLVAAVNVDVRLYDEEGKLLGTSSGVVSADTLQPGAAARFRAAFPGVVNFLAAKFDVQGTPIATGPAKESQPPQP